MSTGQHKRMQTHSPQQENAQSDTQQPLDRCRAAFEQTVHDSPMASTMGAFGIGLGLGAIIGSLLVSPADRRREHLARSLGRRILDSASDFMPASLEKHLRG